MDIRQLQCIRCLNTFKKGSALLSHQRQHAYCREYFDKLAADFRQTNVINDQDDFDTTEPDPPQVEPGMDIDETFIDLDALFDTALASLGRRALLAPTVRDSTPLAPPRPTMPSAPFEATTIDQYDGAGHIVRETIPIYESWHRQHPNPTNNPYHPFKSKLEWDIGRWAKQEGPGATSLDHLLKFESVSRVWLGVRGDKR